MFILMSYTFAFKTVDTKQSYSSIYENKSSESSASIIRSDSTSG